LLYGAELALNVLALDSCIAEALSEEVLGSVSTAVASVSAHGDNQTLVFLVVSEDFLEAVSQVKELLVAGNLALKQHRLDMGLGQVLEVYAEGAGLAVAEEATSALDESLVGLLVAGTVNVAEGALEEI
jgi:hypothetical protein